MLEAPQKSNEQSNNAQPSQLKAPAETPAKNTKTESSASPMKQSAAMQKRGGRFQKGNTENLKQPADMKKKASALQ